MLPLTLALLLAYVLSTDAKQPHILLVIADDLGFNDVGYHNPDIISPTIDKLAKEGVRLENYYVQPICSPSRSQLLSGRYQVHTGLQHSIIWAPQPNGLPLEDKTIADQLKAVGYATHMVGKWHIGFYKKEYTPTYRGFDSFFGYLAGHEDYYNHTLCGSMPGWKPPESTCGVDLHQDTQVVWNNTEYSSMLYARKAREIVDNHDPKKPLFLYLPFQAVHAPLQVPQKYSDMYPFIKNKGRRTFAGMVTCLDEAIKNVTDAFKEAGLWNDTVLIFSTDNGGDVYESGNNYPLRGWKHSLWEGGIHGIGFVHSPWLKKPGRASMDLMHISDWYPTLLHLAGSNASTEHLDGYNQWDTISNNLTGSRKELLHNIDCLYGKRGTRLFPDRFDTRVRTALRSGDWKLLTGDPGNGSWVPPPNWIEPPTPDPSLKDKNLWLFNIKRDPFERFEVSKLYPDVVKQLLERLQSYNTTVVPPRYPKPDNACIPARNGGAWQPWMS